MHDLQRPGGLQRTTYAVGDLEGSIYGDASVSLVELPEAHGQVLHRDEVGFAILPDLEDLDHVRMVDRGGYRRFALEPLRIVVVRSEMGMEHFERDQSTAAIMCPIHNALAP